MSDRDTTAPLVLISAAGLFAWVAYRVVTKRSEEFDRRFQDWSRAHRHRALDVAVKPVTALSLPLVVVSASAALALVLRREGRNGAALAISLAPVIGATAGQSCTTFLPQRNPPDAQDSPNGEVTEPSFPSGHTTGITAEALVVAYVLASEELASPMMVAALVAWPVLGGLTRVYRDRHWISDIIAGWAAGVAIASAVALVYQRVERR
jgi:membrane-associated phospholipid phosphatase